MSSTDGITWTDRTPASNSNWQGVTYGNGLFVAVAATGVNRVMTSPDGITWTSRIDSSDHTWVDVSYGDGVFAAVSENGNVMISYDGINWMDEESPTANYTNDWESITYGNGQFVAVASKGSYNRAMTSGKPDRTIIPTHDVILGNLKVHGNVGIGTSDVSHKLRLLDDTTTNETVFVISDSDTSCYYTANSGTPTCSSDARLKENIVSAGNILEDIMKFEVREFDYRAGGEGYGVIAQEVLEHNPERVSIGDDDYYMVEGFSGWELLKGIQELKTENDALKDDNEMMKEDLCSLGIQRWC